MFKWVMAVAALVGLAAVPTTAEAAGGFTTGNVNMRAGPGTDYPRVAVLPRGIEVEVYGCLQGYSWCDVGIGRDRGWVSSRYISIFYSDEVYVQARPRVVVPRVTFSYGYWDRWYVDRPFYRDYRRDDRPRWREPRPIYRNDPPIYRNDPPRYDRNDRPRVQREDRPRYDRVDRPRPVYEGDRPRRWDNGANDEVQFARPRRDREESRPSRDRGGEGGGWCPPGDNCVYTNDAPQRGGGGVSRND